MEESDEDDDSSCPAPDAYLRGAVAVFGAESLEVHRKCKVYVSAMFDKHSSLYHTLEGTKLLIKKHGKVPGYAPHFTMLEMDIYEKKLAENFHKNHKLVKNIIKDTFGSPGKTDPHCA